MRIGCSPRSRVFVTLVPILFLLFVTYPYFRSFSRPSTNPAFVDTPFHDPPQNQDYPPLGSKPDTNSPLENNGNPDHPIHNVPNLEHDPLIFDSNLNNHLIPSGLAPDVPAPTSAPVPPPPPPDGKPTSSSNQDSSAGPFPYPKKFGNHPIDGLIKAGIAEFSALKKKETHSLKDAAAAYRKRRGRHPPPGFDKWYEFAKSKDAIIIEDLFDPIYEDLEPFWANSPAYIRAQTPHWPSIVTIRNGVAYNFSNNLEGSFDWIDTWTDMLQPVAEYLPDVDLAFNNLDEPRVVLPWKEVDRLMQEANTHKKLAAPEQLSLDYQTMIPLRREDIPLQIQQAWESWHNKTPYWHFVRDACHPNSPAHGTELNSNFTLPPEFPQVFAEESRQGFVANWTFAKSVCLNPHLRNLHGNFIKLRFVSVNTTLFPIFSGSKHEGVNNDIRVPAAKYWASKQLFGGDQDNSTVDADESSKKHPAFEPVIPWQAKDAVVYWRGAGTGGEHDKKNWRAFHRHRFISMMNSTQVSMTEKKLENLTSLSGPDLLSAKPPLPHNFPYPNSRLYPLTAMTTHPTKLGSWLENLTDAAFTHMMCAPQGLSQLTPGLKCAYLDKFYHVVQRSFFNTSYHHKFLPDIDGNGYSGRYRAFLRSKSLPIKATIHSEWHDSRIIPWAHFVPMDNTFSDFYSLLEYFAGNPENKNGGGGLAHFMLEWISWASGGHDGGGSQSHSISSNGHDNMARAIAEQGKDWTDKVLRKEDMVVYMHRLVLEWARINNDNRDKMGWVGDLIDQKKSDVGSNQVNTDAENVDKTPDEHDIQPEVVVEDSDLEPADDQDEDEDEEADQIEDEDLKEKEAVKEEEDEEEDEEEQDEEEEDGDETEDASDTPYNTHEGDDTPGVRDIPNLTTMKKMRAKKTRRRRLTKT